MTITTKPGTTPLSTVWRLLNGFPDGYAFFETSLGDNVAAANRHQLAQALRHLWHKTHGAEALPDSFEVEYIEIHG